MYELFFTPRFQRELHKVVRKNPKLGSKVALQLTRISKDPGNKMLRLHKLSGQNNWSVFVTRDVRVILSIRRNIILCSRIGTHDEVY